MRRRDERPEKATYLPSLALTSAACRSQLKKSPKWSRAYQTPKNCFTVVSPWSKTTPASIVTLQSVNGLAALNDSTITVHKALTWRRIDKPRLGLRRSRFTRKCFRKKQRCLCNKKAKICTPSWKRTKPSLKQCHLRSRCSRSKTNFIRHGRTSWLGKFSPSSEPRKTQSGPSRSSWSKNASLRSSRRIGQKRF